jgi:hypothetical protein
MHCIVRKLLLPGAPCESPAAAAAAAAARRRKWRRRRRRRTEAPAIERAVTKPGNVQEELDKSSQPDPMAMNNAAWCLFNGHTTGSVPRRTALFVPRPATDAPPELTFFRARHRLGQPLIARRGYRKEPEEGARALEGRRQPRSPPRRAAPRLLAGCASAHLTRPPRGRTAGNAGAAYNLGYCYTFGIGSVKQDDQIASDFFAKCAHALSTSQRTDIPWGDHTSVSNVRAAPRGSRAADAPGAPQVPSRADGGAPEVHGEPARPHRQGLAWSAGASGGGGD